LVFPRGERPIAVRYSGYPVVTLRPIEGLEFVKKAVAALGYSDAVIAVCPRAAYG
jgi:hypothetical protein